MWCVAGSKGGKLKEIFPWKEWPDTELPFVQSLSARGPELLKGRFVLAFYKFYFTIQPSGEIEPYFLSLVTFLLPLLSPLGSYTEKAPTFISLKNMVTNFKAIFLELYISRKKKGMVLIIIILNTVIISNNFIFHFQTFCLICPKMCFENEVIKFWLDHNIRIFWLIDPQYNK